MKSYIVFVSLFFCQLVAIGQSPYNPMTNDRIQKVLYRDAEKVEGTSGNWQIEYRQRKVYIITDTDVNRMRIISPVIEASELKAKDLKVLLEANFDRALDAKYSLYQDVLWATYTHPLRELGVEQFRDALNQVTKLVDNYGTSYTSTSLVYGTSE